MKLKSKIEEIYLNEGVRFFKESKKISRLRKKIFGKMNQVSSEEEKEDLREFLDKTEEIAKDFEEIEKKFKKAKSKEEKKKVLEQHKNLKEKFKVLFKNNDAMKTIFALGLGFFAIKVITLMFSHFAAPGVDSNNILNMSVEDNALASLRSQALQDKSTEVLSQARASSNQEAKNFADTLINKYGRSNIDASRLSSLQNEIRRESFNNFWYNRDNW